MGDLREIAEIFLRRLLHVSDIIRNFALRKSETGTQKNGYNSPPHRKGGWER